MVIFKAGEFKSASLARKKRLLSAINLRAQTERGNIVRRIKSFEWTSKSTFVKIDGIRKGAISKEINLLLDNNPSRKLKVLDWGCGEGTAAKELARNSRIKVFGFAIDSSKAWLESSRVDFLHTSVEFLPFFLKRKKIKLDIIYAQDSLKHLPVKKQLKHFCELRDVLNNGGKIFPDEVHLKKEEIVFLEQNGFIVNTRGNFLFSLTKK